ncbi:MAG: hypothetical protein QXQ03_03510 [Candidatus Nezhaarchaeales archaeon]
MRAEIFEQPREVLKRILGLKFIEMERVRRNS